ncbi:MAG: FecR domain-containing protein [Draconibacterium sp.]|nr:FecR domain-containing protein [Draconibacterium sp.]
MEQNITIEQISAETESLFSGAIIEWDTSKELIWEEKFEAIFQKPETKVIHLNSSIIKLSIAASLLILVGFASVAWFYSETFVSPLGTHLSASLPDGSTVEMNAESSLKFYPYRWFVIRDVEFNGEGFFKVQKGKKFVVKSTFGKTSVLGTSFNIFARDNTYRVLCLTGKVRVTNNNKKLVVLNPNQQAIIESDGLLKREIIAKPENVISWTFNKFLFTAAPFNEVLREIERQFGISINTDEHLNGLISCNFQRGTNVEEILSVVCKPLGYKYIKTSDKKYLIKKN